MGQRIAGRGYTPYEGQRVAGLDANETQAIAMAREGAGTFQGDIDSARRLTERSAETFPGADIQSYMNPYLDQALQPAIRDIRQQTAQNVNQARSQAAMAGAFGGSRGAILEGQAQEAGSRAIADTFAQGRFQAFEGAANRWQTDRDNAARAAEQFRATGAQGQQQLAQSINTLLTTGGLRRTLEQAGLDFDYQQAIEARDWDVTNLQPLLQALSTVPHSTTQETKQKTSAMANVVGLASVAAGAYFGGGVGGLFGGKDGGGAAPTPVANVPTGPTFTPTQPTFQTYPVSRPGFGAPMSPFIDQ